MPIKILKDHRFFVHNQDVWDANTINPVAVVPADPTTVNTSYEWVTDKIDIMKDGVAHVIARNRGFRGVSSNDYYMEDASTLGSGKMSAYSTKNSLIQILPGIFQKKTPYAVAAGVWTFDAQPFAELPSITAGSGEGYFYELVRQAPDVADDIMLYNAIPNSIKFGIDVKDKDTMLNMDVDFISNKYASGLAYLDTNVATETISDNSTFDFSEITTFSVNALNFLTDVLSWDLTLTNGAKFVNDNPKGRVIFSEFTGNGTFKILGGANTETLKTITKNSTSPVNLSLIITYAPAKTITFNTSVFLTKYTEDWTDSEIVTFDYTICYTGTVAAPVFCPISILV